GRGARQTFDADFWRICPAARAGAGQLRRGGGLGGGVHRARAHGGQRRAGELDGVPGGGGGDGLPAGADLPQRLQRRVHCRTQQPGAAVLLQVRGAVVGARGLAAVLEPAAFGLRLHRAADQRQAPPAAAAAGGHHLERHPGVFLLLNNFVASPFATIPVGTPVDGSGLNPLLQYTQMDIHPPILYLGYIGFSIPFAFALAALIRKMPGDRWIQVTRQWTMIAWGFLTVGIV